MNSPSFQSADVLIEQILAESKLAMLKKKGKRKKKKSELSACFDFSELDGDCQELFQEKLKKRENCFKEKDSLASDVIMLEEIKKQSLNQEVTLTPTNFVDYVSYEKGILPVSLKSRLTMERQLSVSTNKTSSRKNKGKSSEATGCNKHSVLPEDNQSFLSQSTDELIEQILVESKRTILKVKASKKSEKKRKIKSKLSVIPPLSKANNDCLEPLQAKSKHKKIHARVEDFPALNAIPVEENQNQSVQNEVTLTPTNFVDGNSYEKGRTTSTPKELPALECQVAVSTNKTVSKEKKHRSFEAICHNQQSVFSEESELTSSESVDALIEQILAESKGAILKQKTSRNKSEKKKESKVRVMPISRLSMLDKDCQEPPKRKSKHGRYCTRVTDHSAFTEEAGSILIQSDDAIIQEILAESKRSVLKQKTSKKRTSDISRSSNKDCHQMGVNISAFKRTL